MFQFDDLATARNEARRLAKVWNTRFAVGQFCRPDGDFLLVGPGFLVMDNAQWLTRMRAGEILSLEMIWRDFSCGFRKHHETGELYPCHLEDTTKLNVERVA